MVEKGLKIGSEDGPSDSHRVEIMDKPMDIVKSGNIVPSPWRASLFIGREKKEREKKNRALTMQESRSATVSISIRNKTS